MAQLLEVRPIKRPSATECLSHSWFAGHVSMHALDQRSRANLDTLHRLQTFNGTLKMQQAVLTFIASHLLTS